MRWLDVKPSILEPIFGIVSCLAPLESVTLWDNSQEKDVIFIWGFFWFVFGKMGTFFSQLILGKSTCGRWGPGNWFP